jgi:hypothetical protein
VETLIARVAFWNLLFNDEPVWRLFMSWGIRTGVIHAAQSAAGLLEVVAGRYKFSSIEEFLDSIDPGFLPEKLSKADDMADEGLINDIADEEDPADEEEPLVIMSPTVYCALSHGLLNIVELETFAFPGISEIEVADEDVISTEDLLAGWSAQMDAVLTAVDELGDIFGEATAFCEDLGCPWPWLAAELVDKFHVWIEALLYDLDLEIADTLKQSPPSEAPPVTLEVRSGESVEECLERTRHEYVQWCADLIGPQGAMPRERKEQIIQRYVLWFYQKRILGYSISKIAKLSGADRKTVREGIAKAEYLLSLSPSDHE